MQDCGEPSIDGARRPEGARQGRLVPKTRRASAAASPGRRFRLLADELTDAVLRYDANKRLVCVNAACRRYFSPANGRDGALAPLLVFPPEEAQTYDRLLDRALTTGEPARLAVRLSGVVDDDGRPIDLSIALHPERGAAGRVEGVLAVAHDVSALKRAAEAAETKARGFESLFEAVPDIVVRYDRDLRRTYCNPAGVRALLTPARTLGERIDEGACAADPSEYMRRLRRCLEAKQPQKFEITIRDLAGEMRDHNILMTPEFDASGAAIGVLAMGRDLTEQVNANEHARFLTEHDPLTGLPNRLRLAEELAQAVRDHAAGGRGFALLYLDLDDFKQVNDSFGHELGDELLRQAAQRLSQSVGEAGLAARAGGDEFAVLLKGAVDPDAVRKVAARIVGRLAEPFRFAGRAVGVAASIGAARCPHDDVTVSGLINCADAAMHAAKCSGKNKLEFFSSEITARAVERMRLASVLRHALDRCELELHYQPQFDMVDRRLVGAEALARWNSRELGPTPPSKFIPVAEETGQIGAIGRWIIDQAVGAAARWNRGRAEPTPIAINLSNRQFEDPRLFEEFMATLDRRDCAPAWVEVEITESLLVDQFPHVPEILEMLHAAGVRIAIDDFGTGYSALSYLSRFPIDVLKIDRSFINDLQTGERSRELIKAIVSVARALQMEIIAEGVETPEQAKILVDQGCRVAQGYLYSKPLSRREFERRVLRLPRQTVAA
jgi:diguanylate cyclase (GGDEF)-like protein/PAS domain S-box-containing protein